MFKLQPGWEQADSDRMDCEMEDTECSKWTGKVLVIDLSDLSPKVVSICDISVKTDKPRICCR